MNSLLTEITENTSVRKLIPDHVKWCPTWYIEVKLNQINSLVFNISVKLYGYHWHSNVNDIKSTITTVGVGLLPVWSDCWWLGDEFVLQVLQWSRLVSINYRYCMRICMDTLAHLVHYQQQQLEVSYVLHITIIFTYDNK